MRFIKFLIYHWKQYKYNNKPFDPVLFEEAKNRPLSPEMQQLREVERKLCAKENELCEKEATIKFKEEKLGIVPNDYEKLKAERRAGLR